MFVDEEQWMENANDGEGGHAEERCRMWIRQEPSGAPDDGGDSWEVDPSAPVDAWAASFDLARTVEALEAERDEARAELARLHDRAAATRGQR